MRSRIVGPWVPPVANTVDIFGGMKASLNTLP